MEFWDKFVDILWDSFVDSVKILPIIFLVYVLIEFLESRESSGDRMRKIFGGRYSPFFGAAVGVIPQCGFSVVATKFYQGGFVLTGTLMAVYIATSDEAIPILFSKAVTDPSAFLGLALIIGIKLLYAVLVGFLVNAVLKEKPKSFDEYVDDDHDDRSDEGCCHHHIKSKRATVKTLLVHPLLHSLKIILYIFIVNLAFGVIIELVGGEEALNSFLTSSVMLQPLFSALVGLIPNCASSVVISEMFIDGHLTLGACLAGLCVNSGIATAVLLKDGKNIKRSLLIILAIFLFSLALGYAVSGIQALISI